MSTRDGRSRTSNEQSATGFPVKRHLRIVKEELGDEGEAFVGGAMSLAPVECADDRPPSPGAPGIMLRRSREAQGLTIEDLARTTKITKPILNALESSDVLRLPGPIYTRGFVKAYAREVGLDPDVTAEEYLTELEALQAERPVDDHGAHASKTDAARVTRHGRDQSRDPLPMDQVRQFGWLAAAVAVAGLIAYLLLFGGRDDRADAAGVPIEAATGTDAVAASHTTPENDAREAGAAMAVGEPFRLELRTQGLCWVVISIDGAPVLARLLKPGERHEFDVAEEAVIRVGDPGALTMSINGETGRPLGPAGEPVDVRITATNFHQFLRS